MITLDRRPGHREEHLLIDVDVEVVEETGIVLLLFDFDVVESSQPKLLLTYVFDYDNPPLG